MLWYSNALAKFSGRKPALSAWGEELVDQSLATAWYRADWGNVGDDELAYLLPSLCRRSPADDAGDAQRGPVDYLTRTLVTRAGTTARKIARSFGRTLAASASTVLEHFIASGLVTSVPASQFSEPGGVSEYPCGNIDYGEFQAGRGPADEAGLPGWLITELTALAYADRMLRDASGSVPETCTHPAPLIDWPLSLADVVVATVSTRLNGAYVYDEYDSAHEILSLAAVLGHLVQGRTAYLSPFLAGTLTDILSGPRRTADDDVASVLRSYADLVGGADFLVGRAKVISARGVPRRVSPRPAIDSRDSSRWRWNARLLKRIGERHCWPIPRAS